MKKQLFVYTFLTIIVLTATFVSVSAAEMPEYIGYDYLFVINKADDEVRVNPEDGSIEMNYNIVAFYNGEACIISTVYDYSDNWYAFQHNIATILDVENGKYLLSPGIRICEPYEIQLLDAIFWYDSAENINKIRIGGEAYAVELDECSEFFVKYQNSYGQYERICRYTEDTLPLLNETIIDCAVISVVRDENDNVVSRVLRLAYTTNNRISYSPLNKKYTAYLETNGGVIDSAVYKDVEYGSPYGELPTPTREGYSFDGWYNSNGELVQENTIVREKRDHDLFAEWTKIKNHYDYAFVVNKADDETKVNPEDGSIERYYNLVLFYKGKAVIVPTYRDYTFGTEWDALRCNVATVTDIIDGKYKLSPGILTYDETEIDICTASMQYDYDEKVYKVKIGNTTYNAELDENSEIFVKNMKNGYYESVQRYTLNAMPIMDITRLEGGALRTVQNEDGTVSYVLAAAYTTNDNVTSKKYYIDYCANGGNSAPGISIFNQGESMTVSTSVPEREGYIFCGWSTSPDGEVLYNPGDSYTLSKSITLYAVWVPNVVCGDLNGDGQVNGIDRTILSRHIADWDGYSAEDFVYQAADVDGNGEVNGFDRTILTRHIADWTGYETLPYNG